MSVLADQSNVQNTLTDLEKPLLLTANQTEVVIRFKSNATTGFKWFLKAEDNHLLTPIHHAYLPPSNTKLMGAPGTETFTFHIDPTVYAAPQTGTLNFVYARAWEAMPETVTSIHWVSAP
jgi:hypothetical protein